MGEHGDSEFVAWSTANVSSTPINKIFTKKQMATIEKETARAAYEIIQRKHSTYYGIGIIMTQLVESVLRDSKRVVPVSTEPGSTYGIKGICVGVPCVIGRGGVEKVWKAPLSASELAKLKKSAELLKKTLKGVK